MKWYVLTTRPHHERAVCERLVRKTFEAYLPMARVWRTFNGARRATFVPLFARHVFVRCYLAMHTHLELITTPGAMCLREGPRGGFLVVPDEEIRVLQQITDAGLPLEGAPYTIRGERVQVVQGPLLEVVGIIRDGSQPTLLVPIHALRESVAVRISRSQVIPCADAQGRLTPSESSGG
jgi:hypothetical protein